MPGGGELIAVKRYASVQRDGSIRTRPRFFFLASPLCSASLISSLPPRYLLGNRSARVVQLRLAVAMERVT